MTTVPGRAPGDARRPLVDRLLSAFPLVALVFALFVFYGVEAWSRKTPWIFTDELEWTQISRSIAATGHAARRGQPLYFKSIYAYLIAPFWWIHKTAAAYAAIKYANAVIMTLAAVPTYLLARMLVTRRAATIVAVGSIAVPAMAYATSIVSDVLAYPYFALCSWLSVRAFRSGRRRDLVLAAVFCVCGYFVRQRQFTTLPLSFAVAAFGLWLTGPRGRALRRNWSTRSDTSARSCSPSASLFLFNRVVLQHIYEWQFTTQYYKNRIVDLGLRAGLSLTIGLGVLPVIGGLVSLRLPDRRGDRTYRAYVAWTAAAIATLSIYAADKAAALSLNFATLWEERDLIYLSPLLLLGTAMVFEARRLDWRVVGAATAFVVVMVAFKAIQLGFPYYEAPGSAFAAALAYYSHWSSTEDRLALLGVLVVSVVLIAAAPAPRRRGARRSSSARLDARRGDLDDCRARHGRERLRPQPAGPARLGRRARPRPAGHLPRPGDRRRQRRVAGRVLEPLHRPRGGDRRHRARPRADLDPERRRARRACSQASPATPTCSPTTASRSTRPSWQAATDGELVLYKRRAGRGACSTRRAGVHRQLVPRLVHVHVLQAAPARDARGRDQPQLLRRPAPAAEGTLAVGTVKLSTPSFEPELATARPSHRT